MKNLFASESSRKVKIKIYGGLSGECLNIIYYLPQGGATGLQCPDDQSCTQHLGIIIAVCGIVGCTES